MRICMVAYTFYETDNRVRRYAETLVKRGDEISVVALRQTGQNTYDELNDVKIYRIQERKLNEKGKLSHLHRHLKFLIRSGVFISLRHLRTPYHIVHVHSMPDFEVFAALIPKLMGAKVILDIHDPVPNFFAEKFGSNNSALYIKLLILCEKLSCRFADHVITVTDYWREVISRRSNVLGKKVSVIENFPDTEKFKCSHFRGKEKLNEHFTLLFPGTLQKHCRLDAVIEAVDLLKRKIPLIRFLIYGGGSEYYYLKSMVKKRGLEGIVLFNKFVPLEEVPKLMMKADVGIAVLSADSDYAQQALSVKLFEFLAMGVPVIATKTKALNHYLDGPVAMFTKTNNPVEIASHIMELYLDPGKRKELTKNGREWIKKNNWEAKKRDYYHIIHDLHH